ncbi:MAG: alanine racemase [Candidatus Hinthialibacter antarcticus]|nr:alanine racemase [Candidatus Hinthialibacter antarcticus]
MHHHTRVVVNLRAYQSNIRYLTNCLGAQSKLCAVVKADAYGHGLEQIAPAAVQAGADSLGIVDNWEAKLIRELGIPLPILRLRPALKEEAEEAAQWGVEEIAGSLQNAQIYSAIGAARKQPIGVHVQLDAGIGRMGMYASRQQSDLDALLALPGIKIKGVMTHFPCADEEDRSITKLQLQGFLNDVEAFKRQLPGDIILHASNSAALLRFPDAHLQMARAGIVSYGLKPDLSMEVPHELQPVMQWETKVVLVREVPKGASIGYGMTYKMPGDGRIALLPTGYADGYLRDFSNRTHVLIRGKRFPVVGRISMNLITVDVSDAPEIQEGEEVVLMGRQGNETISASELGKHASTIDYEIVCLIGRCNGKWRHYVSG